MNNNKKLKKLYEYLYKLEYLMDKCPLKEISKFQLLYYKTYIKICELENKLNKNNQKKLEKVSSF